MDKLFRDYGVSLVLMAASLVLLIILAAEWWYYHSELTSLAKGAPVSSSQASLEPMEKTDQELPLASLEQYGDMIQRPLFMEGRRPAPPEEPVAAEAPKADPVPLNLKLMGVVFTPNDKTAMFVDEKGKYKRARMNVVVGGWKLVEVAEDRVVMEQNGERKDLLLIKPKPKVPIQPGIPGGQPVPPPPISANQPHSNSRGGQQGPVPGGQQFSENPDDSGTGDDENIDDSGSEDIQPDEAIDEQ